MRKAMIKGEGLDNFHRQVEKVRKKLERIGGVQSVALNELLTPDFLERFSDFEYLDELVKKSGFSVDTQEDFENIPADEWDNYISQNSLFASWQDLLTAAFAERVKRQFEA
jgi:hypothetical protein